MFKKFLKLTFILISVLTIQLVVLNFVYIKTFQFNKQISKLLTFEPNETNDYEIQSTVNPELETFLKIKTKPTDICNRNVVNKTILIFAYIMINVDNFERRLMIRKTWANSNIFTNLKVAFIIGKSTNESINDLVLNEQNEYQDLIQGDFIDAYRNLTYKSLITWKWIVKNCTNAKIIVKIDEDIVLHARRLLKFFNISENTTDISNKNTFFCHVYNNGSPLKKKISKWYVKNEEYNEKLYNMSNYPTFCLGPSYIMTSDLIPKLYKRSFDIKLFWLEDVYTGLLAKDIRNVNFISIKSKYILKKDIKNNNDFILIKQIYSNDDLKLVIDYLN